MNTASRIESTGLPGRIHISVDTADLLEQSNKGKWIVKRDDQVIAKGKGSLQTYWLKIQEASSCSGSRTTTSQTTGTNTASSVIGRKTDSIVTPQFEQAPQTLQVVNEESKTVLDSLSPKVQRLVKWNVELLLKSLREVVARRISLGTLKPPSKRQSKKLASNNGTVLQEVHEVLDLPQFDAKMYQNMVDPSTIELSHEVVQQLTDFVARVAASYHDNPFHNFERK